MGRRKTSDLGIEIKVKPEEVFVDIGKRISWTEPMHGNKYMQKFDPRMLLEEGYAIEKVISPANYAQGTRARVEVVYDREYVISKLINDVLKPLNPKDYNSFQQLVSEAWKRCRK